MDPRLLRLLHAHRRLDRVRAALRAPVGPIHWAGAENATAGAATWTAVRSGEALQRRLWRMTYGEMIVMTTTETKSRRLADTEVFPIGLGAMPMSVEGRPDEVAPYKRSTGPGPRDHADRYRRRLWPGQTRSATTSASSPRAATWSGDASEVLVATKGGHTRGPGGGVEA